MTNIETTIVVDETELDNVEEIVLEKTDLEEIVDSLTEELSESDNTPYGIFKVLEGIIKVYEVDRTLKPQMFYNYSRNGIIAKREMVVHEKSGKKINVDHRYTKDEVVAFVNKYASKNLVK